MRLHCLIAYIVLSCTAACPGAQPESTPSKQEYLRLADEVEANLQKEILDMWFPVAVDEQGGGFFENYGNDWKRSPGDSKSLVYQSRLTWTSAEAAQRFPAKAEMYLAMTRRGAAVLAEKLWDKQRGGFYWCIDASGQPSQDGATQKHVYGISFGIYALAESYQASKDTATLDLAKRAFRWLDEHAHDNVNKGYFESVTLDGKPVTSGSNPVGARDDQKSMNTCIHVLEALTGLYRAWPDPAVKARVREVYEICRDRVYADPGYLTMFFNAGWQRIAGEDSFGHDVEAGYLLVEAAEILGQGEDRRVWKAARNLTDHAMRYGWDAQRGGLYDSGRIEAEGAITGGLRKEKIWWVEAQLNALLMLHARFGKETSSYWNAFLKQWQFITKFQIDHANGGWYQTVREDGTPISRVKSDRWTECYHQGRAMLNVSAQLRRLAETAPTGVER